MKKDQFMKELRRALAVELSAEEINEHVTYYNEYFSIELSKGRSEEQILDELGEPRLIAKSILGARNSEAVHHEEDYGREKKGLSRSRIQMWLVLVVFLIILVLILVLTLRLVYWLLPVIIALAAIGLLASLIRRLFT